MPRREAELEIPVDSLWQITDPKNPAEYARILTMPWEGRSCRVEFLRITPWLWTSQLDKETLEQAITLGLWIPTDPLISSDATHADLKASSFYRSPIVPSSSGTAHSASTGSSRPRVRRRTDRTDL